MLMCEMMRSKAPSSWYILWHTFLPRDPLFSFPVGPVDPSVENPGKNTAF